MYWVVIAGVRETHVIDQIKNGPTAASTLVKNTKDTPLLMQLKSYQQR